MPAHDAFVIINDIRKILSNLELPIRIEGHPPAITTLATPRMGYTDPIKGKPLESHKPFHWANRWEKKTKTANFVEIHFFKVPKKTPILLRQVDIYSFVSGVINFRIEPLKSRCPKFQRFQVGW